ncbi:hypothetical protein BY458DRAFT_545564 [Sporodiniella umbellata]|nr:hypothetical protein BY458DRAFT_545564 [Sporodiniella umbellata]
MTLLLCFVFNCVNINTSITSMFIHDGSPRKNGWTFHIGKCPNKAYAPFRIASEYRKPILLAKMSCLNSSVLGLKPRFKRVTASGVLFGESLFLQDGKQTRLNFESVSYHYFRHS